MDDEMIDLSGPPVPAPEEDNTVIDVIDPNAVVEPAVDETAEALRAAQEKIAQLEAAQSSSAPLAGLAEEIAKLTKRDEPKPQAPTVAPRDFTKLFNEVNQDFYKDPSQSMVKLLTPILEDFAAGQSIKDSEEGCADLSAICTE